MSSSWLAFFKVECDQRIVVKYKSIIAGEYVADMRVNNAVIIENKAVLQLVEAHEVQLVNYLTATGLETGLLLNFGASRLQFKRKHKSYRPSGNWQGSMSDPSC